MVECSAMKRAVPDLTLFDWILKMPKCYAVYRIPRCDVNPVVYRGSGILSYALIPPQEADELDKYACYARDLGDLTDSQLKKLEIRIGSRISKNWNDDRDVHCTILLMKDSDLDTKARVYLDWMKEQYEKAKKDFNPAIVATVIVPLERCVEIAEEIRKPKLAPRKKGFKANGIPQRLKDLLLNKPKLITCTAVQLAEKLDCSKSSITATQMWKDIMAGRRGARNEYRNKDKVGASDNDADENLDQADDS